MRMQRRLIAYTLTSQAVGPMRSCRNDFTWPIDHLLLALQTATACTSHQENRLINQFLAFLPWWICKLIQEQPEKQQSATNPCKRGLQLHLRSLVHPTPAHQGLAQGSEMYHPQLQATRQMPSSWLQMRMLVRKTIKRCMQNGSRQNLPGLFCWITLSWPSHCSSKTPSSYTSHINKALVRQMRCADSEKSPQRYPGAQRLHCGHTPRTPSPRPALSLPPCNPTTQGHANLECARLQPAQPLRSQDTGLPLPSAHCHHSLTQPRCPTRIYPCPAA